MRLVHADTGVEVVDGETVTDFRGEPAIVVGRDKPRTPNSTGRVYVRPVDSSYDSGYYPSVFNLKWIDDNDTSN